MKSCQIAILCVLGATTHSIDVESVLQVSHKQFPGFGGLDDIPITGGVPTGLFPPDLGCEVDCSCDYLEFLDGVYTITNFFPAPGYVGTWCFPDVYAADECIPVSCTANRTSCTFGTLTMARMDLAGPNDTDLEIKFRMEGDMYNFSVGIVSTGLTFTTDSTTTNVDGSQAVSGTADMSMFADGIPYPLTQKRCAEATLAPTPSPTPSPPPTPSPTPSPTPIPTPLPPPSSAAVGDPHCTNMRGENFEVYKRGKINMVTIPQGRDPAEADFSIMVVVTPTWWKKCAASFISLAVITRESSCEKITIRPGDGLMPQVERLLNAEKTCNQTSTVEEIGEKSLLVKAGERKVKFWQTTKYDKYLNMEVYNLAGEKQQVGGILGLDEHDDESEIPEECKGAKHNLDLEDYHAVTSISFARVI